MAERDAGQPVDADMDVTGRFAAGPRVGIEDRPVVTDRGEVARDRQRSRTRADAAHALPVTRRGGLGQTIRDVALAVGCNAFEAADRDRLLLQATASAGWLTRPV